MESGDLDKNEDADVFPVATPVAQAVNTTSNNNNSSSNVSPVTVSIAAATATAIDLKEIKDIDYSDCDEINRWFIKDNKKNTKYTVYLPVSYKGIHITSYIELGKYESYSPAENKIRFTNGTYDWDSRKKIHLFS